MKPPVVDFHRYTALLEAYCPGCDLQLYSAGGQLVWHHEGTDSAPPSFDLSDWKQDVGELRWQTSEAKEMFAWPVLDDQRDIAFHLIVSAEVDTTQRNELYTRTAPALAAIAHTLIHQLQLDVELDAMARELALRYEELNLVYFTDDEVRFLDEGRQALCALVENCNEYLNVVATGFLMPNLGMCIHQSRNADGFDTEVILASLQKKVVDVLKVESRTLVFNNPEETRQRFGFSCLMIASPVHDGNGDIAGALIIIRKPESDEFVNSDRNLLIVMAGKASKIILSSYDSLTGLMRQDGFDRSLASALSHARYSDQTHALLHLNVDRMHLTNDTMGYQAGDMVLQAVAAEVRINLRETDRIARLGGDEFGILIHGCSIKRGEQVAEKLCRAISELKVDCDTQLTDVSVCIGVATLDKDSQSTISALAGAEIACSVAKELGRNRWHAYRKDDRSLIERQQQMEWVGQLKEAIVKDKFCLYSQKIVPLQDSIKGHHFEILVRLMSDDGSLISPNAFLPVAERYQLMPALDRWIVENAFDELSNHVDAMIEQQVICSINLSGQTLIDPDFAAFVTEQFRVSGVPPSLICFEVTETAAIANLQDAERFMHELKGLGCSFSLDDFGAGLSSFAYLRTLPVDYLKFDGSFVTPIVGDETSAAMLAAMNQIGQILGLRTVAEFVETEAIIDKLKDMGVDYAQGYGILRPRPIGDELEELDQLVMCDEFAVATNQ